MTAGGTHRRAPRKESTNPMTLVFSGWSVLSPFGGGRADFERGIRSGASALRAADPGPDRSPITRVGLVRDFEVREALGSNGTRAMDRLTGLAVKTVGQVLDELPAPANDGADTALVLGTTTGSLRSMMEFVKDSFIQDRPFQVDPARFPNAVMNRAAGQCAIWHGLRGPNTTIAGGRAAGVAVLQYAARLFQRDRAQMVLCGMAEEFSPHRAWVEYLGADDTDRPLGEGCAVFALESAASARSAGRGAVAELVRVRQGVWSAGAPVREVLSRLLRSMLESAGIEADEVAVAMVSGTATTDPWAGFSAGEVAAVRDVLPRTAIRSIADLVGDAGAATGGFQLAALLDANPAVSQPYSLMTSVDLDGVVGCVLIRHYGPTGAKR
ncbi:beta-ketoacyl synthase N-terminal-like domain-containing protein [Nocardia sp. NPDC051321]|uniref:beta-ketoacyl synthase N-terminal-like domain-containing protein n=1 Tax=Nocardia sp. NPDC051321 TaxID=3364323 RepID=UPI0037BA752A